MNRLRSQVAAQKDLDVSKARDLTLDYLDKSLAQTQQERYLAEANRGHGGGTSTLEATSSTAQLDPSMQATDNLLDSKPPALRRK